jgi:hypothetical protein
VAAIGDRTIRFWAVDTGKPLRQYTLAKVLAQCLAFSPDGKTLAMGNGNLSVEVQRGKVPTVWLVDANTGRELRPPLELPEAAQGKPSRIINMNPRIAFSADGKVLAAAATSGGNWGVEHVLQVWDLETGQLLCRLERISNRFALSPDGKTLVTFAGDPNWGELPRVWEVATGKLRAQVRGHLGSVVDAAFSPNGRLLATGSQDTTVLIWDALNLGGEPAAEATLGRTQLEALWADLAGADAARAYRSVRALVAAPGTAVPFLRQRLKPATAPDPKLLARLIADLNDNQFAVRAKATRELVRLGRLARPGLLEALASQPSAEVRRRLDEISQRLDRVAFSAEELRGRRAVEVLEHLGTGQARNLLQQCAREGAEAALLTREAQAALERLRHRPTVP